MAWASRRLREAFDEPADRDRWTQHGSTRRINRSDDLEAAIEYVIDEQGESCTGSEPWRRIWTSPEGINRAAAGLTQESL